MRKRAPAENPFRYGVVATGDHFTDRAEELSELTADLSSAQDVVIFSPRRFGKTSLVLAAAEAAKRRRALVAYLDLFTAPTKDRFANQLADALYGGLVPPAARAGRRALDFFRDLPLRPRATLNPDGSLTFDFAVTERDRDLDQTIEGLLRLPGEVAAERRRRVVLILDEFQEVVGLDPNLPAVMRAVFQLQGEVAHVFLGSRRHLMEHVFTDENEPFYRLAKPLALGPIAEPEFARFIADRFAATGQEVDDEAVARILAVTHGHPHDTQELCYFAWALGRAENAAVTAPVVERALSRVIEAESARHTTLWESLSRRQRLLLTALAEDGEAIYSESFRARHRLGSAATVQASAKALVERELIEATGSGDYRITDVFLRVWIESTMG